MPQPNDTTEDPGADDIMSPGDIKAILAVARRGRPVSCAVALTADKDGLILLDRKVKPKRLAANLRKQCADAGIELQLTTVRFGRASVDTDEDAALVSITINKDPPAILRPRLLKRLKKIGFHDVELYVDAELEEADEDDEVEEGKNQAEPTPALGDRQGNAGGSVRPSLDGRGNLGVGAAAGPSKAPAAHGAAEDIVRHLSELVGQIPAAAKKAPDQRPQLISLAQAASNLVHAGDVRGAEAAEHDLSDVLDRIMNQPAGPDPAKLAKLGTAYGLLRKNIQAGFDDLLARLRDIYQEFGIAEEIANVFKSEIKLLDKLDDTLARKLQTIDASRDAVTRAVSIKDCIKTIQELEVYLQTDPHIRKLDANALVPMQIEKTAVNALKVMRENLLSAI